MRPIDIALQIGSGLFAIKGEAFEPEEESVPVDEADDFEGNEGIFDGEGDEICSGELRSCAGQCGDQGFVRTLVIVNVNPQMSAGRLEAKIKLQIEFGERRDVKILRRAQVENSIIEGDEERLEFLEGVADFRNGGEGGTVGAVTKPDRDGIEGVAEETRVGEQQDAMGPFRDAVAGEKGFGVFAGGAWGELEMVVVAEVIESGLVVAENRDAAGEGRKFIEVEGKKKNAVDELVAFWGKPSVHDRAFVKTGIHGTTNVH